MPTLCGSLELSVRGGSWRKRQAPPAYLHLLPTDRGWQALAFDQSGGLRGGDRLDTHIDVSQGGHLDWAPPAASLYYPDLSGQLACRLRTGVRVEAGSSLHFRPKAAIPCGPVEVDQDIDLEVAPGADFLFWDLWTSGRVAADEDGRFRRLSSRLDLRRDGRLIFREAWSVDGVALGREPSRMQAAKLWGLGLAQGPIGHQALLRSAAAWRAAGARVEVGTLADNLFVLRLLSPVALDLG